MQIKDVSMGALAGAALSFLTLKGHFEAAAERKVRTEVQVVVVEARLAALIAEVVEHKKDIKGKFWTIEADLKRLDKEIAVKHATGH